MSLGITHFTFGVGMTTLIVYFVYPRLSYQRTVIILGGAWALVPDLHYISPAFNGSLRDLKFTILGDVFWFHRVLDGLTPGRGSRQTAAVMVLFLLFVTLVTEWLDQPSQPTESSDG